jgi:hypothetical protein
MLKHASFTEVLLSNPYRLRLIVDYVQIYLERNKSTSITQKHLFHSDLYRPETTYARHRTAKSNSTSKTGIGNALARSTVPVSIPA